MGSPNIFVIASAFDVVLKIEASHPTAPQIDVVKTNAFYRTPMRSTLLLLFLFLLLSISLNAREFTNIEGKTITAEVESVSEAGADQTVTLKRSDGAEFTIPVNTLSDADQKYLDKLSDKGIKGVPAKEDTAQSVVAKMLKGKLVKRDRRRVMPFELTSDPDYYVFYYPDSKYLEGKNYDKRMVETYDDHLSEREECEFILVSSARDENLMNDHILDRDMSFPALKHEYCKDEEFRKHLFGRLPFILILDRNGDVIAKSINEDRVPVSPSVPLKILKDLID